MRKVFFLGLLISLGIAFLATAANAQAPNIAFTSSGSCLNSTSNFDSNLEPINRTRAGRTHSL
jgi:hypothetical protein